MLSADEPPPPEASSVVLVRIDHVFEERVIRALVEAGPDRVIAIPGAGAPVAVAAHVRPGLRAELAVSLAQGSTTGLPEGVEVIEPGQLSGAYEHALRKREAPYVMPLSPETLPAVERRMFQGAYKGVTDLVTKWVWPWPARYVTKWAAERGISPNLVTAVSLVCVVAAFLLFIQGQFLAGLVAAWLMTFLDTVDGKLARLTLTSTKWGNVFDHSIDLVHPPFWYIAWASGLGAEPGRMFGEYIDLVLIVIVVGYLLGRIQEGIFLGLFKIEMHAWRRLDSRFRLITARRNPNLLLLTIGAVVGRPELGFAAVAGWTVISLLFHTVRILQSLAARRRGPITSWLAEEARP